MKAVVVEHRGSPGALKEMPDPQPGVHEVLVHVCAAGVNPVDWKVRDAGTRPMPYVLGQDFSGTVAAVGSAVRRYRYGERIFGVAHDRGAFAEYTIVPEESTSQPAAKIPDDVGYADAAALPTAGITALGSLDALQAAKGTTLVVVGATGGVGTFAVQIARDRGAHVIASGRASNERLARELGADEYVAYDREDVFAAIARAHPGGVDAVLDLVDDADAIGRTAGTIREGGRIVSTIHAADAAWFSARKILAENLRMTHTPASSHEGLRTLVKMLEEGRLRTVIAAERPLSEAVDALEESKRGAVAGKLVLMVE
ncbi:MAG: NADP-dependent oxidoreductase [Candidatus Tyrphobacter sp.]